MASRRPLLSKVAQTRPSSASPTCQFAAALANGVHREAHALARRGPGG